MINDFKYSCSIYFMTWNCGVTCSTSARCQVGVKGNTKIVRVRGMPVNMPKNRPYTVWNSR